MAAAVAATVAVAVAVAVALVVAVATAVGRHSDDFWATLGRLLDDFCMTSATTTGVTVDSDWVKY